MRGAGGVMVALCCGAFSLSPAMAQSKPQVTPILMPRYDIAIGYNNIRANAPPASCNCFDTNGGFVSAGVHINNWFGLAGEFTGNRQSHISALGQDLTLTTFTAGPRFSYAWHRAVPFGEVMVGGAHGSDSYFPSLNSSSTSATSFAVSAGGGLDFNLTPRFAVRALNLEYLRTTFPNGTDNEQNHLMIGAGIVIKLHGANPVPVVAPTPPPPPPPANVALSCSTNAANVTVGQVVIITGDARTQPDKMDLDYAWLTDGGTIEGKGNVVSIDTTNLAVGDYRVKGHASLLTSPAVSADCTAVFRVVTPEPPPAAPNTFVTLVDPASKDEKQFRENVKDAYFDVNSAKIRPDTLATIVHAAQYLTSHPTIQVIISGWTDPRGSMSFNLALGIKRATAVRQALIDAGVSAANLEIISNGKSSQVCTTADQTCWQQNRRVSFTMKP